MSLRITGVVLISSLAVGCVASHHVGRNAAAFRALAPAAEAIEELAYAVHHLPEPSWSDENPAMQLVSPPPPPGSHPDGPVIVYVPDPDARPKPVDPVRACAVLHRHADEFARYWSARYHGGGAKRIPSVLQEFTAGCLALPDALRKCLYEPYRAQNVDACDELFSKADATVREQVDRLYLEPVEPVRAAR